MSTRLTFLLTAAVLALPLPAYADCAARIAAMEDHPSIGEAQTSESQMPGGQSAEQGGQQAQRPPAADGSVRVDGGASTHPQGGPATPSESWFTDSEDEDKVSVLTHLETAKKAQQAGKEQACLDAVQQAESALQDK
jgi:hypothetical protein